MMLLVVKTAQAATVVNDLSDCEVRDLINIEKKARICGLFAGC